jgi:dipeptidyl aminopeptidase/acylaminoacyl peptidase
MWGSARNQVGAEIRRRTMQTTGTPGTPGRRGARLLVTIGMAAVLAACTRPSPPASSAPQGAANAAPATAAAPPLASQAHAGRIVFDNHQDVWTMNADGTDLTRLTHSPGFDFDPSWSPDGTQIAYRHERNDEAEIWLMNPDGSGQRRLARGIAPAWSPDGSMIAYVQLASYRQHLSWSRLQRRNPRRQGK